MEMKAVAPWRGDIRDDIKKLTIIANDEHEQRVLAQFYKAFCRGDHATLQVVAASNDTSELMPV